MNAQKAGSLIDNRLKPIVERLNHLECIEHGGHTWELRSLGYRWSSFRKVGTDPEYFYECIRCGKKRFRSLPELSASERAHLRQLGILKRKKK